MALRYIPSRGNAVFTKYIITKNQNIIKMKFSIKSTYPPEQMQGGATVYGTGPTPFISSSEDLHNILVGKDKIKFKTGLDEEDILSNRDLTDDEKMVYKDLVPEARKRVEKSFGKDALDFTNQSFWNPERTTLKITNTTFSNVFDDENVDDLIFRMSVIAGGYSTIAPTLEIAERTGKKFYLTGEEEFLEKNYEEEYGMKRKAIGALNDLLELKGIDALLYLTWNTVDSNNGFTKNTSKQVFEKTLMEFIEGKHVKYDKKDCAKKFYNNYIEWKNNKEAVIAKAIFNAAYHFGIIYLDEGTFKTSKRLTQLGSNISDSIKILMKPEHTNEFIEIKKEVDEKLNN